MPAGQKLNRNATYVIMKIKILTVFNVNLRLLSEYRTPLMGIAALMIILCHANGYGVAVPHAVRSLLTLGNMGVDIFLFLSGIGCFYSLSKEPDTAKWYKKRFVRIFIPYALFRNCLHAKKAINSGKKLDCLTEKFKTTGRKIPFARQGTSAGDGNCTNGDGNRTNVGGICANGDEGRRTCTAEPEFPPR